MYYTTPRHQVVLCELHCNPIILKNQALRIFMRLVFFFCFFFSTSEPEYLLQPSEASVWDRTALVWRLHHRHWSGSVLQVGCVKIWQLSCFIYSQRYNESFHLEDRSCFFLCNHFFPVIFVSFIDSFVLLLSVCRKRTMFQNIVNATEPMTDEKEATAYVSNNPVRKEIVMYVLVIT